MRIGLYPFPSSGDMSANLAHIRTGAALAAEQSVELLVFHECALCGYPPLMRQPVPAYRPYGWAGTRRCW